MEPVAPQIKAMLVCDTIITEKGTNKKSLIGIFESIGVTGKPPWKHNALGVYIKFTDAEGAYDFRLELIDLQTNQKAGEGRLPSLTVRDRLASHELTFNLKGLCFSHAGKYQFNIYANEKMLGSKDFNIIVRKRTE